MENIILTSYDVFCYVLKVYGIYFAAISIFFLLKPRKTSPANRHLRFAVLIAARNEESCIKGIVESMQHQNYPQELVDVYVIPNNCTDATEQRAREAGATIISVSSSVRSKGAALREAFAQLLAEETHDAYCVFDADNEACPDFLSQMNAALCTKARAAKSRIHAKNAHEGWVCSCYETYFCNANLFLNTARDRLGLSARLIGTGFAVRRDLMEELGGWNTESLTEDAEFYAALAATGERVAFVPDAVTYDEEPLSFRESILQRRRWMSGVMGVGRKKAATLLRGLFRKGGSLIALDALMQFSFACVQALILPFWLLRLIALPESSLLMIPAAALAFYICTLLTGFAALLLDKRLTKHTAMTLPIYPVFIFSFIPLQSLSLFLPNRKWHPIRHSGVRLQRSDKENRNHSLRNG